MPFPARRRVRLATLAALALACPCGAEPVFKGDPVPASMLDGRTLVLKDVGVTIDAPSSAHRWSKTEMPSPIEGQKVPASMYVCQNSMNDSELPYFLVVARGEVGELTPAIVDKFVQGLKQGSGRSGMIFARPETKPSGIPFPGRSYRYRYELVSARGDGVMFGYLGATKNALLTTQCITFDGFEPSAFARFSQSVKVKEDAAPPAVALPTASGAARTGGALLGGGLLVAIIVFAAARNRSRYDGPVRPAPRPPQRPGPPSRPA